MLSAYHQYFLYNGEKLKSGDFNNKILNQGISIYEVIRIIRGKSLFFDDHYERLVNSAKILSFDLWVSREEIIRQMNELANINAVQNGNIEIIFNISENSIRTFTCLFIEDRYPTPEMIENGVSSDFHYAERNNPAAKVINLELRTKTVKQIKKDALYELILVDRNNHVTEGSRSNIFFIKGSTVYTTPVSEVLPGITRSKVIEMCRKNDIPVEEISIKADELGKFEAAFFTGTSPKVLPIHNIGQLKFDPQFELLKKIVKFFDQEIEKHISTKRITGN